ncbi:putative ORFan [Tupanvirus deep ocean]|uniref:ORFan n=2 Tax=Tupanvirus TaxID=2094720 RepID=A0AC62A9W7_9VIRU|nr:putative ORFan [Tupanvirus deep ocean]QKU34577.1 putative ORFan [Tupanvirus deep ocean]
MSSDNSDIENDFLTIDVDCNISNDDSVDDDKNNDNNSNDEILFDPPNKTTTNSGLKNLQLIPKNSISVRTSQINLSPQQSEQNNERYTLSLPIDGPENNELRRFIEMMDERMSSYARQNYQTLTAQNTVATVNNTNISQQQYNAHRHFEQTMGRLNRSNMNEFTVQNMNEFTIHGRNYEPSGSVNSSSEYNTSPREIFQNSQSSDPEIYTGARVMPSGDTWPESRRSYFDDDRHKPHFNFVSSKHIDFDLENHGLEYIHEQIKIFKGYKFSFDTTYRGKQAYGEGATRQVYTKLCNDLVGTIMKKISPYFMDIDPNHPFWDSDENIECFVMFVGMVIDSECVLPYHFSPALLEAISNKKMELKHLEFFMDKLYPTEYTIVKKVHPKDFDLLDSDYVDHEDYYRSKIIGSLNRKKINIYASISKYFELFDSFYDYDILVIDSTFSGNYHITPDMVLANINFTDSNRQSLWENFVKSLTETELKQMLILFGNTTSLDKHYTVCVSKTLKTDIHITTCMQMVTISENLFEHEEYLNNLKLYFSDFDQISDSPSVFRNYDDNSMTFRPLSYNTEDDITYTRQTYWRNFYPFFSRVLAPEPTTIRRDVANLDSYNADFDGDELDIEYESFFPSLLLNGRPIYGDTDSVFVRVETPVSNTFRYQSHQVAITLARSKIEQKSKERKDKPRTSRNAMRRSNNIVRQSSRNTSRKFKSNYH